MAVVINGQTAGAAEALAAILRENEVALLIGSATAGQASMFKEFPLENGQRLRIATAPVRLGNGKVLASLTPDIAVSVGADDDEKHFSDAPKKSPLGAPGRPLRPPPHPRPVPRPERPPPAGHGGAWACWAGGRERQTNGATTRGPERREDEENPAQASTRAPLGDGALLGPTAGHAQNAASPFSKN